MALSTGSAVERRQSRRACPYEKELKVPQLRYRCPSKEAVKYLSRITLFLSVTGP